MSIGRYTEIDSLSTGLVFRYGLRNMLMTSRDANSHRWFSWDVFMDAYLHDPVNQRDFPTFFIHALESRSLDGIPVGNAGSRFG